jgi:HK97 family phage portal protein
MGALPLHVFELVLGDDKRPGKRLAFEHQAYDLLRWQPNEEMTAITFRRTLQAHALLWGNCYAEIQRDGGNRPLALWPRNPARTRPHRVFDGTLVFKTTEGVEEQTEVYDAAPPNVGERTIAAEDMLAIPGGITLDGRLAQSTIQLARQAVGLALATEKYGAKYFGNGARPGGVLEHPGKLTPQARETLKRSWQEAQGGENAHRVAVLEEGMKWAEAANKPEEAQFLETRKFQRDEICAVFRVPPHMIGETDKQNRANTEQIALEFLTFCIGPWIESWEQETRRKLFPSVGRTAGKFFPKFETRRLTMPDAESRRNFYATGKQWGYLSTNDIREFEDLNPVDEEAADAYWMPVNMAEMGAPAQQGNSSGSGSGAPAQEEPAPDKAGLRLLAAYRRLFRDAVGRALPRSGGAVTPAGFRRIFEPLLAAIAADLTAQAAAEFNREAPAADALATFLTDYLDVLQFRAASTWTPADADDLADRELGRALRAISIEAYRSLATARAKQVMEASC